MFFKTNVAGIGLGHFQHSEKGVPGLKSQQTGNESTLAIICDYFSSYRIWFFTLTLFGDLW